MSNQFNLDSIEYSEGAERLSAEIVVPLYRSAGWSAANKPKQLLSALANSHSLITAWDGDKLVGLANAISDGHLVVYYPHLLVDPRYQGRGIGRELMSQVRASYTGFHQQVLVADKAAIKFYEKCGFQKAGETESMWIYVGGDHR